MTCGYVQYNFYQEIAKRGSAALDIGQGGGGRRGVEFRHLQKDSRLVNAAVNYDWAETSKTGLKVTLWSAPVAAGRFFGLRGWAGVCPARGQSVHPVSRIWASPVPYLEN